MKFFVFFSMIVFCSCHLEVNTVDPQAGKTMAFSKSHQFFIDSCKILPSSQRHYVKEAWIEKTWKKEIKNFQVGYKEIGTKQLIIRFDSSFSLSQREYFKTWEMKDSLYGSLGMRSGVYTLSLGENPIPREYKIDIFQLLPQEQLLYTFRLKRM